MADAEPFLAECKRCGGKFGHPGPCPRCCPRSAYRINLAKNLANDAHDMQFRRGRSRKTCNGPNYICHPALVVRQLWDWGFEVDPHEDLFCVGWLHDAVEEKGTTIEEITKYLGSIVAGDVKELTLEDGADKAVYIASFMDPKLTSVRSLIVKAADRIWNVEDFMVSDRVLPAKYQYARKYLLKGEDIFAALRERKSEVVEYAGMGFSLYDDLCEEQGNRVFDMMMLSASDLSVTLNGPTR